MQSPSMSELLSQEKLSRKQRNTSRPFSPLRIMLELINDILDYSNGCGSGMGWNL